MITEEQLPNVAQQVNKILANLADRASVHWVILATEDGLIVGETATSSPQRAAIVSFLGASVRQACIMLGFQPGNEIAIRMENGRLLITRTFQVNNNHMLLATVLNQQAAHRHLLSQTIQGIQNTLEEETLWP